MVSTPAPVPAAPALRVLPRFARQVADWLLPPTCAACDALVAEPGALCARCWSDTRYVAAPLCPVLGTPFGHDLGEGIVSAQALADPPSFDAARAAVLYDDTARRLVSGLKFADRSDLVPTMARAMLRAARPLLPDDGKAVLVVPVPLHRRRLAKRRYNQAAELARTLAAMARREGFDCRHAPLVLERRRATRPQVGLDRKARTRNVAGAFRVPPGAKTQLLHARILLVDDVFTTGATLSACARALARAGSERIDCITYARVPPADLAERAPPSRSGP